MKPFIAVLAFLLLAGCAEEQTISVADRDKPVEFVQQIPGKTANRIFSSTQAWIAETFMLGRAVVTDDNRKTGHIALKAHIPYPCDRENCTDATILFKMQFNIGNEKLNLAFSDVRIHNPQDDSGNSEGEPVKYQRDMDVVKSEFKRLNDGLHASLMGDQSTIYFH